MKQRKGAANTKKTKKQQQQQQQQQQQKAHAASNASDFARLPSRPPSRMGPPVPRREGMGCFLGPCLLGVCVGMTLMAIVFNFGRPEVALKQAPAAAVATALHSGPRLVPRALQNPIGLEASCALAESYLTLASEVAAAGDDFHWGWLYLLAAHDLCPTDGHILSNLASNYEAAGYIDIALDELETLGLTLDAVIRERRGADSHETPRANGTSSGNSQNVTVMAGSNGSGGRLGITPRGALEERKFLVALREQRAHIHNLVRDLEQRKRTDVHAQLFAVLNDEDDATTRDETVAVAAYAEAAATLPPARLQLPFATAVAQWDFSQESQFGGMNALHTGLYDATMEGYWLMLKEMGPELQSGFSDTELNHRFFNWQMKHLHSKGRFVCDCWVIAQLRQPSFDCSRFATSWILRFTAFANRYWAGFEKDALWQQLAVSTKAAAAELLQTYGFSAHEAWQKASHRTVLWASVHTGVPHSSLAFGFRLLSSTLCNCEFMAGFKLLVIATWPGSSLHEPHMTKDSLVGGVYYVNIPPGSGDLVLFDPRGMSPMLSQNVSQRVRAKAEVRRLPSFALVVSVCLRTKVLNASACFMECCKHTSHWALASRSRLSTAP